MSLSGTIGNSGKEKGRTKLFVLFVLALPIFPVRLQTSIFGTGELNFRVRNGNGWTLALISTNSMSSGLAGEQTVLYCGLCCLSRPLEKWVTRTGIEPMFAA